MAAVYQKADAGNDAPQASPARREARSAVAHRQLLAFDRTVERELHHRLLKSFELILGLAFNCCNLALGLAFQALSGFWMAQLDVTMNATDVFWMNVMQGFGFGLGYTPMAKLKN